MLLNKSIQIVFLHIILSYCTCMEYITTFRNYVKIRRSDTISRKYYAFIEL
jgi:hypothetical protein